MRVGSEAQTHVSVRVARRLVQSRAQLRVARAVCAPAFLRREAATGRGNTRRHRLRMVRSAEVYISGESAHMSETNCRSWVRLWGQLYSFGASRRGGGGGRQTGPRVGSPTLWPKSEPGGWTKLGASGALRRG